MIDEEFSEEYEALDGYFCRICERSNIFLRKWQKAFIEVYHSRALIENGGFHNYLCEFGTKAKITADAHEAVGLIESAGLIHEAIQLWKDFGGTNLPDYGDPDEFRELFDDQLSEIENKFYGLGELDHFRLYELLKKLNKV